jgi:hypothetical protein
MTSFWYRWNGGNTIGNNGKNVFSFMASPSSPGPTTFDASFTGTLSSTYRFVSFFSSDPAEIGGTIVSPDQIQVTNQRSKFGDFFWWAVVERIATSSVTFLCHPVISNRRVAGMK